MTTIEMQAMGERAVQAMGGGHLYHFLTPDVIVTDKTFTPGCLWSLPEGHQVGKSWVSNHRQSMEGGTFPLPPRLLSSPSISLVMKLDPLTFLL